MDTRMGDAKGKKVKVTKAKTSETSFEKSGVWMKRKLRCSTPSCGSKDLSECSVNQSFIGILDHFWCTVQVFRVASYIPAAIGFTYFYFSVLKIKLKEHS